jgi:hypothetical protein
MSKLAFANSRSGKIYYGFPLACSPKIRTQPSTIFVLPWSRGEAVLDKVHPLQSLSVRLLFGNRFSGDTMLVFSRRSCSDES